MSKKGNRSQEESVQRNPFRVVRIVLIVVLAVLVAGAIAAAIYLNTGYSAGAQAQSALQSDKNVIVTTQDDGDIVFSPASEGDVKAGLIFYPGGRVDQKAYAPLMRQCAEEGFLCILIKMPFNLAVFDQGAANGEQDAFPTIGHWYIGGHSLGGAIAAQYAANHAESYDGLFLCAAYSTSDLSGSNLKVLSVYGSNDGVLNRDAYEQNKSNVPQMTEDVIQGGCHSYFGDYGLQNGDGTPTITMEEQVSQATDDLRALLDIKHGDD